MQHGQLLVSSLGRSLAFPQPSWRGGGGPEHEHRGENLLPDFHPREPVSPGSSSQVGHQATGPWCATSLHKPSIFYRKRWPFFFRPSSPTYSQSVYSSQDSSAEIQQLGCLGIAGCGGDDPRKLLHMSQGRFPPLPPLPGWWWGLHAMCCAAVIHPHPRRKRGNEESKGKERALGFTVPL